VQVYGNKSSEGWVRLGAIGGPGVSSWKEGFGDWHVKGAEGRKVGVTFDGGG